MNKVRIKLLSPNAVKPETWAENNGSMTIAAYAKSPDGHSIKIAIPPHSPRLIQTGIAVEAPPGYLAFLMSRKDAARRSLSVVNAPIIQDLEGEISFVMMNSGLETQYIAHGDWVAHLVFLSGVKVEFEVV